MVYKRVFIIGAPRSGTSFTLALLNATNEFCILNEPRQLWKSVRGSLFDDIPKTHEDFLFIESYLGARDTVEKTPASVLHYDFFKSYYQDALFIILERNYDQNLRSIRSYWNSYRSRLFKAKRLVSGERIIKERIRGSKYLSRRQRVYLFLEFCVRFIFSIWGPITKKIFFSSLLRGRQYAAKAQLDLCRSHLNKFRSLPNVFSLNIESLTIDEVEALCCFIKCDAQGAIEHYNQFYKNSRS